MLARSFTESWEKMRCVRSVVKILSGSVFERFEGSREDICNGPGTRRVMAPVRVGDDDREIWREPTRLGVPGMDI